MFNIQWKSKDFDSMFIFIIVVICFGTSTLITIHTDDNHYTIQEKTSIIMNLVGFSGLLLLQIKNRWLFGVILTLILMSLSIYRIMDCYNIV